MELVPTPERPLVSLADACKAIAELLGEQRPLTRPRLYRFIAAGMPSRQPVPNGARYFDIDAVADWLRCRCNASAPGQRTVA